MKMKSLGLLTMSVVLLGACGNNSNSSDTKSENTNKQDKDTTVIALNDIKTSPEEAIKKAQSVYKGQNLKGISYEKQMANGHIKLNNKSQVRNLK